MADIVYAVQVALGGSLVDVTGDIDGFACSGGRQRDYDQFPVGSCQFTVDDRTGDYVPQAGGTWNSETWVGREVVVSATCDTVTNVIWRGHVEDIDVDLFGQFAAAVGVLAVEPTAMLGRTDIAAGATFGSEVSDVRINNVLALPEVSVGYFTGGTLDIDAGTVTLQADADPSGNTLSYLDAVVRSEGGRLYVAHGGPIGGRLTFRNRLDVADGSGLLFQDTDDGSASVVQGGDATTTSFVTTYDGGDAATVAFARTVDGGDADLTQSVPYEQVGIQFGSELLTNRLVYTREGGTDQVVEDEQSQARYGIRTTSDGGLLNVNDADVAALAGVRLARYRTPQRHVNRLRVLLDVLSDTQAALVLELTVGDRVEVQVHPPGSTDTGPFTIAARVEAVAHQVSAGPAGTHTVDLALTTLGEAVTRLIDGGDADTVTFVGTFDGGDAATSTFDGAADGGDAFTS